MTATAQWRRWINGWIDKAGGLSGLAFRIPVHVSTVGRWRDGIAFPEADHQEMLAQKSPLDKPGALCYLCKAWTAR